MHVAWAGIETEGSTMVPEGVRTSGRLFCSLRADRGAFEDHKIREWSLRGCSCELRTLVCSANLHTKRIQWSRQDTRSTCDIFDDGKLTIFII